MKRSIGFVSVALIAAAPASAIELFPGGIGCFQRDYSPEHLARHPMQMVTAMRLTGPPADAVIGDFALDLSMSLRDDGEIYSGIAYCEPAGPGLSCGLEGDAGNFTIFAAGAGAIMLRIGNGGIVLEGTRRFVELSGTSGDDREFLLRPDCR